ncbi:chitinase-like protein 1 [Selaginella moellendorffii]|nr:chitinase-like protein 1 [Selaginella moellendorffii]|eukprot:XP_002985308.2 chitinase-like protein 1 [Selaginella moellendorffii]
MNRGMAASSCIALLGVLVALGFAGLAAAKGGGNVELAAKPKNKTVAEIFTSDLFDLMFNHRNEPQTHAQGFYDHYSFITAAKTMEKEGFGVTGGETVQKREIAAFLAHVAHETTCGYSAAKGGPYAWGLCYKEELSPPKIYCEDSFLYPCSKGVSYHGRGALPLYWNYNYGPAAKYLKLDLMNHPEMVSENATVAFQAAIFKWITPVKPKQPSPHEVMVNKWKPSRNDTLSFRSPGFGMTINIMAGDDECGHGSDPKMEDRIAHYNYFLNIIDKDVDPGLNLDCGSQGVLNPPNPVQ